MKISSENYHLLIDEQTHAVLTVSTRKDIVVFLKSCFADVYVVFLANQPNYTGSFLRKFSLLLEKPENYPRWSWDYKRRMFRRTGNSVLREDLFKKSRLAQAKRVLIGRIQSHLADDRILFSENLPYQETVYSIKKMQAMDFQKSGYDESLIMNYPYIVQYADFANISLRQAADDILFQVQLYEDRLLRNESLRLKYYTAVRNMSTPSQGNFLRKELYRELYGNSLE